LNEAIQGFSDSSFLPEPASVGTVTAQ